MVGSFTDGDLHDVVAAARDEAEGIVEQDLGAAVDDALRVLARAGELTGQAAWTGRLLDTRRQLAWTGGRRAVGSTHLSAAREALERAAAEVAAEVEERHRPEPVHHAPTVAPEAGTWPRARARRMSSEPELPPRVQERVDTAIRTEESLRRAVELLVPEPEEPPTGIEAFAARLREQRRQEDQRQRVVQAAMFQDAQAPDAEDDPLRVVAAQQAASRRRRRRIRGHLPY